MTKELGDFFFVLCQHRFDDLSPETAGRLIYLCTYLYYDNTLMLTQRKQMRKNDLEEVLGLSKSAVFRFWHEVSPNYIAEDDSGLISVDHDIFRGKISEIKFTQYQMMYINCIRKLYHTTQTSQHKYLGHIYKILPYLNTEYNIICANPTETNLNEIRPLTVTEFCELIGYDKGNFDRIKKTYKKIIFDVNGHQEYFLTFVTNGEESDIKMFVNPHILYCGGDYKKVEVLGAFVRKN